MVSYSSTITRVTWFLVTPVPTRVSYLLLLRIYYSSIITRVTYLVFKYPLLLLKSNITSKSSAMPMKKSKRPFPPLLSLYPPPIIILLLMVTSKFLNVLSRVNRIHTETSSEIDKQYRIQRYRLINNTEYRDIDR